MSISKKECLSETQITPAFKAAAKRWSDMRDAQALADYGDDRCEPPDFASNDDALHALRSAKSAVLARQISKGGVKRMHLSFEDAACVIAQTVALTVSPGPHQTLLVYNYDTHVYEYSLNLLNCYVVELLGKSSSPIIASMTQTLAGMPASLAVYNPLPPYKIAVGNGIFNCLTKTLEPYTPNVTVLSRIKTDYKPNTKLPSWFNDLTFDKLVVDLANGNQDRIELLHQICKSIVTGHNVAPAFFIVLGRGGDGKSTFFSMIAEMIGIENTAYINFKEFSEPDKLYETVNKTFALGVDNDINLYVKSTTKLKSMATHEMITHSRKYLSAMSAKFTATSVQLCNEMPRFAETTASMQRRIVVFSAEKSHYVAGDEERSFDRLVQEPVFSEHVLACILDDMHVCYYDDYNDVDHALLDNALKVEDLLSQFVLDLDMTGLFDAQVKSIPSTHLYAAYQAWMKSSSGGASLLSSRGFSLKITPYLSRYGFEPDASSRPVRPLSLAKTGGYAPEMFGHLRTSKQFEESLEANVASRVYRRVHAPIESIKPRRHAKHCSAYEYFGVSSLIVDWLKETDKNQYTVWQSEIAAASKSKRSRKASNDVSDHSSAAVDLKPMPNVSLVGALISHDSSRLAQLKSWLDEAVVKWPKCPTDPDKYYEMLSAIDVVTESAEQVTDKLISDAVTDSTRPEGASLKAMLQSIDSMPAQQTAKALSKMITSLIEIIDRQASHEIASRETSS